MGNRSSTADNEWDSEEEGGSDYEHAYDFHTSVLHKSPADGFESDYEDDDEDHFERKRRPMTRSRVAGGSTDVASAPPPAPSNGGDAMGNNSGGEIEKPNSASEGTARVDQPTTHQQPIPSSSGDHVPYEHHDLQPPRGSKKGSEVGVSSVGKAVTGNRSVPSTSQQRTSVVLVERGNGDDDFETASEGSEMGDARRTRGQGDEVSDDDSLSTITPPRTRPQSDSDRSLTEESEQEDDQIDAEDDDDEDDSDDDDEEEEEEEEEEDTPVANIQQQNRNSPRSTADMQHSQQPSPRQRQLPRREGRSPTSYRQSRKRSPSPQTAIPTKRRKTNDGITFSPNRVRYGMFDTESESDAPSRRTSRKRPAPLTPSPPQQRNWLEASPLSARTLRRAARKAASQFVETSRRILREAKTAARILRQSTTPKRKSSFVEEEEEEEEGERGRGGTPRKRNRKTASSPGSRGEMESRSIGSVNHPNEDLAGPSTGVASRQSKRRNTSQILSQSRARGRRAVDVSSDESSDDFPESRREVRKDGGKRRKFTRSNTDIKATRRSPRFSHAESVLPRSNSLPLNSGRGSRTVTPSLRSSDRNTKFNNSFPSSGKQKSLPSSTNQNNSHPSSANQNNSHPSSANPFHSLTLVPTSSQWNKSTGSTDSISHELSSPLAPSSQTLPSIQSPFTSLLTHTEVTETPQCVTLRSGSVWARVNTGSRSVGSPQPGTSRMMEPASPPWVPAVYPAHSTPTVPALTLTAQLTQSGRFTFTLENVVQVTVAMDNITTATTSAVVISTDSLLRHTSAMAQSVAKAAGIGFTQACQDFVQRNSRGLQVCEVLDTPAGGRLSPLVSRVMHVVTPERSGVSDPDGCQHRKLLLCTYLNCLKHVGQKLSLPSVTLPLLAADQNSTDECVQVFFDALLVYLAERPPTSALHLIHLSVHNQSVARFCASVMEARLDSVQADGIDSAMAAVFRDYFNVVDFTRNTQPVAMATPQSRGAVDMKERNSSGKPAVKRRRL